MLLFVLVLLGLLRFCCGFTLAACPVLLPELNPDGRNKKPLSFASSNFQLLKESGFRNSMAVWAVSGSQIYC